jgi:hypothetical protein
MGRFGYGEFLEAIPASMWSAKSEIWRKRHYSVGVLFMELT